MRLLALGMLKQICARLCHATMSTTTPIIPPGSPLQRQGPPPNSTFLVTVCAIVAVHVVLLAGLLIQGCKREDRNAATDLTTNHEPAFVAPVQSTNPMAEPSKPVLSPAPAETPVAPPPAPTNVSALPGAEPLTNPLGGVSPPSVTQANAPKVAPPAGIEGETVYKVKQGDTLTRIARSHGTTVQALRALNALKTDRILVGQKLKIPAKGTAEPAPAGSTNAPAEK
jgi:LysM repeat protein